MSLIKWGRSLGHTLATGLIWRSEQYLYERSLQPSPTDPQVALPAGVTYTFVDRENVDLIRDWRGDSEARRFRRFLNRGDIGVYALAGGQVVHYRWAALNLPGYGWAHTHDPIEWGDALLHRAYTREDYRCRGVYTYGLMRILAFLREQYDPRGLRRVCALVNIDNPPPQRVLARMGFHRTQQVSLVRLLGTLFFYRIRAISPDLTAEADAPAMTQVAPAMTQVAPARTQVRFKVPEVLWDLWLTALRTRFRQDK